MVQSGDPTVLATLLGRLMATARIKLVRPQRLEWPRATPLADVLAFYELYELRWAAAQGGTA